MNGAPATHNRDWWMQNTPRFQQSPACRHARIGRSIGLGGFWEKSPPHGGGGTPAPTSTGTVPRYRPTRLLF